MNNPYDGSLIIDAENLMGKFKEKLDIDKLIQEKLAELKTQYLFSHAEES